MRTAVRAGIMLTAVVLSGCAAVPSPADRRARADAIARAAGFKKEMIAANGFVLLTYRRTRVIGAPLTVYIEGDGYAWKSRRRLSGDPTPTDPVALRLAVRDPSDNVVYLARPCQYVTGDDRPHCATKYWSTQRFSEAVIAASNHAIEAVRAQIQSPNVSLVGYSGGGAVAALVAARRKDVARLRTVAAPLDHRAFTMRHDVTPLHGSLNPIDDAAALSKIPQIHFVGGNDTVVPPDIDRDFIRRTNGRGCAVLAVIPGVSHFNGWVAVWPTLLTRPVTCRR